MKFNKQELLNLACQSSNRFVKEGPLVIYERQDGLFKRSEGNPARVIAVIHLAYTYIFLHFWFVVCVYSQHEHVVNFVCLFGLLCLCS